MSAYKRYLTVQMTDDNMQRKGRWDTDSEEAQERRVEQT